MNINIKIIFKIYFFPCESDKEKNKMLLFEVTKRICFTFFFFLSLPQGEVIFKENFYININEQININISADDHPVTFV